MCGKMTDGDTIIPHDIYHDAKVKRITSCMNVYQRQDTTDMETYHKNICCWKDIG